MSQPAAAALAPLPFELVYDDGEPLETEWHTIQYPLLRDLIQQAMLYGLLRAGLSGRSFLRITHWIPP